MAKAKKKAAPKKKVAKKVEPPVKANWKELADRHKELRALIHEGKLNPGDVIPKTNMLLSHEKWWRLQDGSMS
jgi:hypothetical protein